MQNIKEKAQNAAASAKAGMEKTKASTDAQVDKMKTRDPMEKAGADARKDERMTEADMRKQTEKTENAAEKGHKAATGTGGLTGLGNTGGVTGTELELEGITHTLTLVGWGVEYEKLYF